MKREWKPGDVAMVSSRLTGERVATWAPECYSSSHPREAHWHIARRNTYLDASASGINARPLVVIDPEDREAVERLRFMIADLVSPSQLREALDHYLDPKPPKPEEPTGLGAVVEDAGGDRWVWMAAGADGAHWLRVGMPRGSVWRSWANVDAVRVLSEGVQA